MLAVGHERFEESFIVQKSPESLELTHCQIADIRGLVMTAMCAAFY
jgi:hypothetical protein